MKDKIYCVDCKHFSPNIIGGRCDSPRNYNYEVSRIDGSTIKNKLTNASFDCESNRSESHACGVDGNFFEKDVNRSIWKKIKIAYCGY